MGCEQQVNLQDLAIINSVPWFDRQEQKSSKSVEIHTSSSLSL